MSRALALTLALVALVTADAALLARLLARVGRRVTRWSWAVDWSGAGAEKTWHMWTARGKDGALRLVVQGAKSVEVWSTDGRREAEGQVPWGSDVGIGDLDGDGADDIAVATESLPPNAPVSIQVVDQALHPITPNVGVLEGLEVPASVAIVPFAKGPQVVAADFRGCLVALVQADMAWEHCFPRATVGGDPYAIRHLAAVDAGGRRLVVAARATGELAALDGEGREVWSYRITEPLTAFATARAPGGPIVFAGGDKGAFAVVDALTGTARASGRLPGTVSVARAAPDATGPAASLLVGGMAQPSIQHRDGYVAVLGLDGAMRARFPIEGQVMDVASVDLDGDGEDEIVAITGGFRLLALTPTGRLLLRQRIADPSRTKLAVRRAGAQSRLFVSGSGRLEARRGVRIEAPPWYAPLPAATVVATLLALAFGVLVLLRPPAPVR